MDDPKVTIVFKKSPDYRIVGANTYHGGPTPTGDGILLHFCIDHATVPSYYVHKIVDGQINMSSPDEVAQGGEVERELMSGVFLTIDGAKGLRNWLTKVLEPFEQNQ
jgi:hypothetical protein